MEKKQSAERSPMKQFTHTQNLFVGMQKEEKWHDRDNLVKMSSPPKLKVHFCRLYIAAFIPALSCRSWCCLIFSCFKAYLIIYREQNSSNRRHSCQKNKHWFCQWLKTQRNGRELWGEAAQMFLAEALPLKSTANTSHARVEQEHYCHFSRWEMHPPYSSEHHTAVLLAEYKYFGQAFFTHL